MNSRVLGFALLALIVVSVSGGYADDKKKCGNKLLNNFKVTVFGKTDTKPLQNIADAVFTRICKLWPLKNITDDFLNIAMGECGLSVVSKLLSAKSSNDKCLKEKKETITTMDLLGNVAKIIAVKLEAAYKKLFTKAKDMAANGATQDACKAKMANMGVAVLTVDLMKKVVTACANQIKCPQWQCAVAHVSDLIGVNSYNCTSVKNNCIIN